MEHLRFMPQSGAKSAGNEQRRSGGKKNGTNMNVQKKRSHPATTGGEKEECRRAMDIGSAKANPTEARTK